MSPWIDMEKINVCVGVELKKINKICKNECLMRLIYVFIMMSEFISC